MAGRKHLIKIFAISGICIVLAGCASSKAEIVTLKRMPYEKNTYETVKIQKGDLTPEATLKLSAQQTKTYSYDAVNPEMQLDKVYVAVGDKVKKGDLLVSFKSEDLQQKIEQYEDTIKQNQMLIDHYTRLDDINSQYTDDKDTLNGTEPAEIPEDYSADIDSLKKDLEVAELYLTEAKDKLAKYQIVAKDDGTIIHMDNSLEAGTYVPGEGVIKESCGSGMYEAEIPAGFSFEENQEYMAVLYDDGGSENLQFQMKVKEINDEKIVFEPETDMSALDEGTQLSIYVSKPPFKDVLYVEKAAVHTAESGEFVYRVDDDGYRDAVKVTAADTVGSYIVIENGVSEGDEVTLK